ncbi:hypothetical protein A3I80_06135 [Candidatus Gottesmanbacteria bacterium RIFCSPLOWO2_02_FULL_40_10]|uniref:Hydrogenase/sulfur reductase subunit alpha n=1 Tax=Candidatus Gottesmanbacteria bacterium RIFCSPHIGHO2_01_FULL_40_15 TaxID=1798376 RepID=A0A1F5Z6Z6_9BACT|nr:MAG: hypothetical protein A2777_02135 [Candidatus Gottesmanbacteria bacterium RIFCSPHIGHO2_01_FULL_40_15]OGG32603.1 MAG: hypothetical protein A3I80_06135 [Candidatus Gottesmanbacteria bacterium RIFCSPLOWO2_02_FULL_40_10]
MHNLDLSLSDISKIEGKASCEIKIRNGKLQDIKFSIAEYKRFYTQAIRGKDIAALPQLTARICGTCSNAHLLCAVKAVENALAVSVSPQTVNLRKLLNYGLFIRDHALHLYVFVLPDLFGKDSILDFDESDSLEHQMLHNAFIVKAAGNQLGKTVGGRSVHAPFIIPGGFTRLPLTDDLKKTGEQLEKIRPLVLDLIDLFFKKDGRLLRKNLLYASLIDDELSFLSGSLFSSNGDIVGEKKFGDYLEKVIIPYSHATGYKYLGKTYMVGALARLNLAKDKLHKRTVKDTEKYLKIFPSQNIYHNNLAQAIEILHAVDSSLEIINNIKIYPESQVVLQRKESIGVGVVEAPRGTLYYRLEVDAGGKIKNGRIVVPTGQNQIGIEESIRQFIIDNMAAIKDKSSLEHTIESIVRAYDPCMSCASHFLKFRYL